MKPEIPNDFLIRGSSQPRPPEAFLKWTASYKRKKAVPRTPTPPRPNREEEKITHQHVQPTAKLRMTVLRRHIKKHRRRNCSSAQIE